MAGRMGPERSEYLKPWILQICYIIWQKWSQTLRYGDSSDYSTGAVSLHEPLKSEHFLWLESERYGWRENWKVWSGRGIQLNSTGGGHMESMSKNSSASRHKTDPWLTDNKEPAISVLQQGVELDQQLE